MTATEWFVILVFVVPLALCLYRLEQYRRLVHHMAHHCPGAEVEDDHAEEHAHA